MKKKEKDKLARKAFDIMRSAENTVKLSELGKIELEKPCSNVSDKSPTGHSKQTWHINSLNVFGELEIVSDDHHIMGNCPIEWFELNEVSLDSSQH